MSDKWVLLLDDKARPHTAHAIVNLLERWGWEILQHPPYNPDLAPLDFHLFPNMKKHHMMMSSMRCKHGCLVRIPPSIDKVLRNGFPAWTSVSTQKVTMWKNSEVK
jgi:transposase